MNKKVVIGIIVTIIIAVALGIGIVFMMNRPQTNPEDIWQKYISLINEQKYEEMYEMLTEDSKAQISQEDFIERNQNIYEGISMSNMKSETVLIEDEKSTTKAIDYNLEMETEAGNVSFTNTVRLTKDKEKGYLINWSSNLIFPQLNNTDKVRIKTIEAKRGEIVDKNGTLLAGEGTVSSVGIVPGKLGENKDADLEQMATLLGISVDTINNALKASWVK